MLECILILTVSENKNVRGIFSCEVMFSVINTNDLFLFFKADYLHSITHLFNSLVVM